MPNIAIYEGGKAARMNGVSRITTDDGNDGKIVWVPQSDRQTGTLYVSENGTYRAEDEGLHSWSKVTVRLAGAPLGLEVPTLPDPITGAEIPTGELGELEPVPPAGLEPIEDEPISVDEAEKILDEAGLDHSDLESDDALEAIADALGTDPDNVKVVDPENKEDVKKEQPKVEDKGQKATGTDPDTGEPANITPSGKEDAVEYDELRIVTPPGRTNYKDGDTIDYSGISCALYKDGKFVRSATFDELSFPMSTAEYDGELPDEYTNGQGINAVKITFYQGGFYYHYVERMHDYEKIPVIVSNFIGVYKGIPVAFGGMDSAAEGFLVTKYEGQAYAKGEGPTSLFQYRDKAEDEFKWEWGWMIAATSPPLFHTDVFSTIPWAEYLTAVPTSTVNPKLEGAAPMWEVGQKQPVPVQCAGLSASFIIMVTKSSLD